MAMAPAAVEAALRPARQFLAEETDWTGQDHLRRPTTRLGYAEAVVRSLVDLVERLTAEQTVDRLLDEERRP